MKKGDLRILKDIHLQSQMLPAGMINHGLDRNSVLSWEIHLHEEPKVSAVGFSSSPNFHFCLPEKDGGT